MPQNEIANSPSTPLLLTDRHRTRGRCSSATSPTAASSAPTWRRSTASTRARCSGSPRAWRRASPRSTSGPDGAIYVGGLGAGGNWGQDGKLTYGLQKLTPNGTSTFDMLAMRATAERVRDGVHPAAVGGDRGRPGDRVPGQAVAVRADRGLRRPEDRRGDADGHLGDRCPPTARRSRSPINGLQGRPGRVRPLAAAVHLDQRPVAVEHRGVVHAQRHPRRRRRRRTWRWASRRPPTASCNADEGPAKAVNGSVTGGNTDKWCSLGATKWLQVDLGCQPDA